MKDSKKFWNKEYSTPGIFNLSTEPAEDLKKFTRWLEREYGKGFLDNRTDVLDLGCGNGRNLIYLSESFGCRGYGYDISDEAINQAKSASKGLPLTFQARTIAGRFELENESMDIVIDMMASHYLKEKERVIYLNEIVRIIKPGGWMFFKSFLKEEDQHAERLLKQNSAGEEDSYIHPKHGTYEHVWAEEKMIEFFEPYFDIEKVERSGKHLMNGRAFKRRHVIVYLRKKF
ncbi:MAG: class I SAM-dependent methyltransferase [bacterium]